MLSKSDLRVIRDKWFRAAKKVCEPRPLQIAFLLVLLPWIAACTRRLRDA